MTIETYLRDLGTYLQNNSFGTMGTDIHCIGFDESASNDINLNPFQGSEFEGIVSGELNPYTPNLSVLVRNTDSEAALSKATGIYKLLRTVENQTIGTTNFVYIRAESTPGFVSKKNNNYIFSVNFSLMLE